MKKASRFAALLAAVMLFGSVAAMPALAEDVTPTPVPTATAEPTVTPAPTDNGQSAPNNSGSAYIIAQTVTDAAGGEITTIDRDSRFNLILRVADYGAYNNFIPADQISARINSSAFTFTGNAEVGQLYEETDANGAGYYSYVLLFRDVIYNGGGNSVPINLSYLNSTMAMQQLSVTLGQCVDEDPDTPNLMIRASSYGNEALHLIVGDNYLLAATGIGDILQISNHRLDTLHFGRTSVNKNQIVNNRNQDTDFFSFLHTYLVLHGDKTAQVLFRKQPHSVSLTTVCGTHSEPYFGLFFHFHYTIISEKDILPGL